MKLSICIPIHDTPNTAFFLSRALNSIANQTFTDYEIVITKEGQFAENHNAAIKKAKGDIVQMLQMDDYFSHTHALENIVRGFDKGAVWQITACLHYDGKVVDGLHKPEWTDDICTGNNRLGSVSTLSFKRENALLFEEPLQWIVDCELYYRLNLKYGEPHILLTPNVVIDTRIHRLTHTLLDEVKISEVNYLRKKYGK